MTSIKNINLSQQVTAEFNQTRLDLALSALFPKYSRARLQQWIEQKLVTVDGEVLRKSDKVSALQTLKIEARDALETEAQPQNIAFKIAYEDTDLIVVNKPAGLTVHPGAGQKDNTLLNALLYYDPKLANVPRAGIVHRLDKDTSGLLVIARNLESHHKLVTELQAREIKREYEAIVYGRMISGGTINASIGRHRTKRTLMAIVEDGREATTHYRIIERFPSHTHLRLILETGRTHQIRVHLAHIEHPIVGDAVYGRLKFPKGADPKLCEALKNFKRQALHAKYLALTHPTSGKLMEWNSELPKDMKRLLNILRKS